MESTMNGISVAPWLIPFYIAYFLGPMVLAYKISRYLMRLDRKWYQSSRAIFAVSAIAMNFPVSVREGIDNEIVSPLLSVIVLGGIDKVSISCLSVFFALVLVLLTMLVAVKLFPKSIKKSEKEIRSSGVDEMGLAKVCRQCKYERKASDTTPQLSCPSCGAAYEKAISPKKTLKRYVPNSVELKVRLASIAASAFLIIVGTIGIAENDLVVPLRRRRDIHLHDEQAILMFVAYICAAAVLISVVIDHYDKRENESDYRKFQMIFCAFGVIFFTISLLMGGR